MRQPIYQAYYIRYQFWFYLWRIGPVVKHCKVPKNYGQDCLEIFLLLSTLPAMIQTSGKNAHLAQKSYFYQKSTNKISKLEFWYKTNMRIKTYAKLLNFEFLRSWLTLYFYYRLEKYFEIIVNVKVLKFEGDWTTLWQTFACSGNPKQKNLEIWKKKWTKYGDPVKSDRTRKI